MELSQSAWVGIAFIIFFILIGKKGYTVIASVLDTRKKLIEKELDQAIKLRQEAQNELNENLKKQKQITSEIEAILHEAKETSKKIKSDAEKKVLELIKRKEEQANQKIQASQSDIINQIKNIGTDIAIKSSKTYIKENIDDKSIKILFKKSNKELINKL